MDWTLPSHQNTICVGERGREQGEWCAAFRGQEEWTRRLCRVEGQVLPCDHRSHLGSAHPLNTCVGKERERVRGFDDETFNFGVAMAELRHLLPSGRLECSSQRPSYRRLYTRLGLLISSLLLSSLSLRRHLSRPPSPTPSLSPSYDVTATLFYPSPAQTAIQEAAPTGPRLRLETHALVLVQWARARSPPLGPMCARTYGLKWRGDKGLLSCRKLAARLWGALLCKALVCSCPVSLRFCRPSDSLRHSNTANSLHLWPDHPTPQETPSFPRSGAGRPFALATRRAQSPPKSCRWPSFRNRPSSFSLSTPSASCPSSGCVSYSRARSSPSTRASDPLPSFPSFLWKARKVGRLTLRSRVGETGT